MKHIRPQLLEDMGELTPTLEDSFNTEWDALFSWEVKGDVLEIMDWE